MANASNWIIYEKHVDYYDGLMQSALDIKKNESKPYFEEDTLKEVHNTNKKKTISEV